YMFHAPAPSGKSCHTPRISLKGGIFPPRARSAGQATSPRACGSRAPVVLPAGLLFPVFLERCVVQKSSMLAGLGVLATLVICPPRSVTAGTIISTNLPAGSLIVNIDGRQDGAAGFNGFGRAGLGSGQDDWYRPFNLSQHLLEVTFQPGTYTFRL